MSEKCCSQAVNFLFKFTRYRRISRPCFLCFILHILLPKSNDKVVAEICIVEYIMTTVAHVRIHKNVKYHQNQISTHNQLETEQTREALPQKKFTNSQNVFM